MVGNYDPTAVRSAVDAVTATGSLEGKAISMQGPDRLAGSNPMPQTAHTFTATAGVGNSRAPPSGSTGTGSPLSRRSST